MMKSIQMKLTLTLLVIFLVALSALGGFNYWKARAIVTEFVARDMQKAAENSAGDVGDWLDARKAEISIMAVAPVVQAGNPEAIVPFLANATKSSKDYDGINYRIETKSPLVFRVLFTVLALWGVAFMGHYLFSGWSSQKEYAQKKSAKEAMLAAEQLKGVAPQAARSSPPRRRRLRCCRRS